MTQRTSQQNRALHKDCALIAEKLNDAGLDMRTMIKPNINIPWTTEAVKECIWKPIMKALYGHSSPTELAKIEGEIDKIHQVIMRELGEKYGIEHHDFPVDKKKQEEKLSGYKTAAGQTPKGVEYPESVGTPTV